MKKYLCLICGLWTMTALQAQFSLGVSGGINLSNSTYSEVLEIDTKTALNYFMGISPRYNFTSRFALLVDLEYSEKGFRLDDSMILGEAESQYVYFDIAPEIEYGLTNFLTLGAGFYAGFKLKEDLNVSQGAPPLLEQLELVKKSDFGILGSVRVDLKYFFLKFSYQHGIENITKLVFTDDSGQPINDAKQQNRNFQIGLGYYFQL